MRKCAIGYLMSYGEAGLGVSRMFAYALPDYEYLLLGGGNSRCQMLKGCCLLHDDLNSPWLDDASFERILAHFVPPLPLIYLSTSLSQASSWRLTAACEFATWQGPQQKSSVADP